MSCFSDAVDVILPSSGGGGTPGGSSGSIQFNDAGAFGGFGNYDSGTGLVTLPGALSVGGAAYPTSSDGGALGSSSLQWSDLFLASGGVINWNSGNATLTHSSALLTSNVNVAVPDDPYNASTWDGSVNVPTKNAIRDKIESFPTLASGTYTPTASNYVNVSDTTPSTARYLQIGSQVCVFGRVVIVSTVSNIDDPCFIQLTLPVSTANFAAASDGAGVFGDRQTDSGFIEATVGSQTMKFVFSPLATGAGSFTYNFCFCYSVQ